VRATRVQMAKVMHASRGQPAAFCAAFATSRVRNPRTNIFVKSLLIEH